LSPWVDLGLTGDSLRTRADREMVISPAWLEACAEQYLGGTDPRHPSASPLYAELGGLCPLLVLVGTEEILFDDASRLDGRAVAAGGEANLEVFDGCFHLWMVFAPYVPEARDAIERAGAFLRRHLG
jgi:acetyl esterase/lipase